MMEDNDKSQSIFGNQIPAKVYRKAVKQKKRFANKFGYNPSSTYPLYAYRG